jgi:hypothetical protein
MFDVEDLPMPLIEAGGWTRTKPRVSTRGEHTYV